MSAIIARLLVSIVFMLATPVVYFLLAFFMFEALDMHEEGLVFLIVTALMLPAVILGWLMLWGREVNWTQARTSMTAGLGLGLAVPAGLVGVVIAGMVRYEGAGLGLVIGGMVWALGWFGLTPLLWKETRGERHARLQAMGNDGIACPVCGYNMTGLREARCPECGATFTLDQLYGDLLESRQPIEAR